MTNTNQREIAIETGDCSSCQGCIDMNPDIFEWNDVLDMPFVSRSIVSEEEIRDIVNCCPEGCIIFVD